MRRLLTFLCDLLLRIFFRHIDVVGRHHIPEEGGVIFALNHPSGLIDPLFVLCLSGRKVSFLAKAPLFHMPFIGMFVRAFECLPVHRSADGNDPSKNREMMKRAEQLLTGGNALAIFPEATTHDDSSLKPFRSGAARIALSAEALGSAPVFIVPGALYYEEKQTFRSRAVLAFGPPLEVRGAQLDAAGEPALEGAQEYTAALRSAVQALVPIAQTPRGLALAENAERVFSAAVRDTPERCPRARQALAAPSRPSLSERMTTRNRILGGYHHLVERAPERVSALISRIEELATELETAGLPIDARPHRSGLDALRLRHVLALLSLSPLALVGTLLHLPAYVLIRSIAFRYSKNEMAVVATTKLVAGLLFFPLTWLLGAFGVVSLWGGTWGAVAFFIGPLLGWVTMHFHDFLASWGHHLRLLRRARRATLGWENVIARRALIAEQMAHLMAEVGTEVAAQELSAPPALTPQAHGQ